MKWADDEQGGHWLRAGEVLLRHYGRGRRPVVLPVRLVGGCLPRMQVRPRPVVRHERVLGDGVVSLLSTPGGWDYFHLRFDRPEGEGPAEAIYVCWN